MTCLLSEAETQRIEQCAKLAGVSVTQWLLWAGPSIKTSKSCTRVDKLLGVPREFTRGNSVPARVDESMRRIYRYHCAKLNGLNSTKSNS